MPFQTLFVRRMSAGGPLTRLECPEAVFRVSAYKFTARSRWLVKEILLDGPR